MNAPLRVSALLTAAIAMLAPGLAAQSLQRLSFQASGAALFATRKDPDFESKTRLGFEGQARYTFGRFSLGVGYQRSTVFAFTGNTLRMALSLGFVEPRYVVAAGGGVAAYVAGRVGVGKLVCSNQGECDTGGTNIAYGGGGGLLFRLSQRLSADAGVQYFQVDGTFSSGYAMARLGLGIGL
jgi:opacity protein-like surface antigen